MLNRLKQVPFYIWLTIIYGICLAISLYHHELWRDETETWMIAAGSHSPAEIFRNARYEGHPYLWFFVVWPFTYFNSPDWVKVPHFLIAVGSCYLIARYTPFPKWVTLLLMFGYFFFYEYGAISRNYQLGVMGVMGFCLLYPVALRKPWVGAIFLCIAAGAHFLSLIIALALGFYFLVGLVQKILSEKMPTSFTVQVAACAILFLAFTGINILLLLPTNEGFGHEWLTAFDHDRFNCVFQLFWRAFLPIPKDIMAFWNTSIFESSWEKYLGVTLLFALPILMIRHRWHALFYFLIAMGIVTFQYSMYAGYLRHSGMIWLAFVGVITLICVRYGWQQLPKPVKTGFIVLLLIHGYVGIMATAKDIRYPFSGGKATWNYVKKAGYANYHVIGHVDYVVSTFTAYYGKPVYYVISDTMGTYVKWNNKRMHYHMPYYLNEHKEALQAAAESTIILSDDPLPGFDWLELKYYSGRSIEETERLYVYTIKPLGKLGNQ